MGETGGEGAGPGVKEYEGDGCAGHDWMARVIKEVVGGQPMSQLGCDIGWSQKSTCDDARVKWAKSSLSPRPHTAEDHQVTEAILMESALRESEALWSVDSNSAFFQLNITVADILEDHLNT